MRILLLEDDVPTAAAIERGLVQEGHGVVVALDLESALGATEEGRFDAAVLDVVVPGGSGYEVLDRLRASSDAHVLMLTARGGVEDRVEGLDRGADDYLVKPFSFGELAARLRALERRRHSGPAVLRSGEIELDPATRLATARGQRIDMTPTEFLLLATLLRAGGAPVTRRELLRDVWGYEFDPGTNVVDVHVNRIRRKLELAGIDDAIRTVRGSGYAAA